MCLGFIFILFFLLHVCMFFRKYTLLLNNVFVGVAVVLQCFAVNPAMFILGRFVVGINAGKVWPSMQVRCGTPPVGVGVVAAVHHTMLYFGRSSSFAFFHKIENIAKIMIFEELSNAAFSCCSK